MKRNLSTNFIKEFCEVVEYAKIKYSTKLDKTDATILSFVRDNITKLAKEDKEETSDLVALTFVVFAQNDIMMPEITDELNRIDKFSLDSYDVLINFMMETTEEDVDNVVQLYIAMCKAQNVIDFLFK